MKRGKPDARWKTRPSALILIADDDLYVRQMLRHLFERDHHDVIEAEDGEKAWDPVSARRPAILVTDLEMPGLDASCLPRRLRESGWRQFRLLAEPDQPTTRAEPSP